MRHFLTIEDTSADDLRDLLTLAAALKRDRRSHADALRGKEIALIFQKPSLRTRVSFEVAVSHLGGHGIRLMPDEIGMGKRESTPDVARLLSRMVDGIMARVFGHSELDELVQWGSVPVINGLSDTEHPCQALADVMTIIERCGDMRGVRVAYIGDANNVARSLALAVLKLGGSFAIAAPDGYDFSIGERDRLTALAQAHGGAFDAGRDPIAAARGADVLYTDTWVSMGQEDETAVRVNAFQGYQINADLMAAAGGAPWIMHCLPAHRGYEITDEAADSASSIIFDQAENRLHAQKALLIRLFNDGNQAEGG